MSIGLPSKEDKTQSVSTPPEKNGNESYNVVGVNVLNQNGVNVPDHTVSSLVKKVSVKVDAVHADG